MPRLCPLTAALLSGLLLAGCASEPPAPVPPPVTPVAPVAAPGLNIPVEYYRLANGLRVVLSPDASVPSTTVGVYYNIGFRVEPRERTGFAHLFEHLMFQASENLGKLEFVRLIQSNGGVMNGSTRFDFTNYFEVVPANVLETLLWAEADRMKGLAITTDNLNNQRDVVKNEVRVNVLNQPYGGFPWLDMPQFANRNWYNAHNFYGDLADLDKATLSDVQTFFDSYYAPGNAVLVVAGAFDVPATKAWIEKYFGVIPARAIPPRPDISEARQEEERHGSRVDPLAPKPALAFAYQMPPRGSPQYYAMGVIDELLLQGSDSELHQRLVKQKGITESVDGGINMLGNMFNYQGPMLWIGYLIHDPSADSAAILAELDAAVARLQNAPLPQADIDRALTKIRSGLYDVTGTGTRFGLVDLLASFALFDDRPAKINEIEREFRAVTPALVQQTARDYLRQTNRTILTIDTPPQAKAGGAP